MDAPDSAPDTTSWPREFGLPLVEAVFDALAAFLCAQLSHFLFEHGTAPPDGPTFAVPGCRGCTELLTLQAGIAARLASEATENAQRSRALTTIPTDGGSDDRS